MDFIGQDLLVGGEVQQQWAENNGGGDWPLTF